MEEDIRNGRPVNTEIRLHPHHWQVIAHTKATILFSILAIIMPDRRNLEDEHRLVFVTKRTHKINLASRKRKMPWQRPDA